MHEIMRTTPKIMGPFPITYSCARTVQVGATYRSHCIMPNQYSAADTFRYLKLQRKAAVYSWCQLKHSCIYVRLISYASSHVLCMLKKIALFSLISQKLITHKFHVMH